MKFTTAKLCFVATVFIFHFENAISQSYYFDALKLYDKNEYEPAIPLLIKSIEKEKSTELLEKLAYCYFSTENYKQAEQTYKQVMEQNDYSPNALKCYAESLQKNEHFVESIQQFEKLLISNPQLSVVVNKKIANCKQAIEWKLMDQKNVSIENLKMLNTKYDESGIHIGNNNIYFGSSRKISKSIDEANNKKFDVNNFRIYSSKFSDLNEVKSFKPPYLLPINKLNEHDDVSNPSFNAKEEICYFSKSYSYTMGMKKFHSLVEATITEIFIYQSIKMKNKWSEAIPIVNLDKINYHMLHPCLSKDGNRLYFASNANSDNSNYDIYYLEKTATGLWSEPINLGNLINTKGNELFPSYADDKVLYFSSNGHVGMGDLDIFKANLENGKIISIENLKYPINSTYNDHSFVPGNTNTSGLFCSNRPGGLGNDDIYYFKMKK